MGDILQKSLVLKNVCKTYSTYEKAVVDFNLEIIGKEFIVIIGPSGCGKSSLLRMIAGIEDITSGEILIDDKVVNDLEPRERDIAMVFQDYALYANLTIYENLAFSLILRKVSEDEIESRVMELANKLGLVSILNSYPNQLSGGQKQRVAVGRSIIRRPVAFLLDEPLSNVDNKLRALLRKELSSIYEKLDTTFIYVTHEQSEAMTLATRIIVMNKGKVQQIGTPKEIYDNPQNVFVATFMGTPPMNCLKGVLDESGYFIKDDLKVKLLDKQFNALKELGYVSSNIYLGIRPHNIKVSEQENSMLLNVDYTETLGSFNLIYTKEGIIIKTNANYMPLEEDIKVEFDLDKVLFYDNNEAIINI